MAGFLAGAPDATAADTTVASVAGLLTRPVLTGPEVAWTEGSDHDLAVRAARPGGPARELWRGAFATSGGPVPSIPVPGDELVGSRGWVAARILRVLRSGPGCPAPLPGRPPPPCPPSQPARTQVDLLLAPPGGRLESIRSYPGGTDPGCQPAGVVAGPALDGGRLLWAEGPRPCSGGEQKRAPCRVLLREPSGAVRVLVTARTACFNAVALRGRYAAWTRTNVYARVVVRDLRKGRDAYTVPTDTDIGLDLDVAADGTTTLLGRTCLDRACQRAEAGPAWASAARPVLHYFELDPRAQGLRFVSGHRLGFRLPLNRPCAGGVGFELTDLQSRTAQLAAFPHRCGAPPVSFRGADGDARRLAYALGRPDGTATIRVRRIRIPRRLRAFVLR